MCNNNSFCQGENDVEYAEFSMTQRMLMREPSPAAANTAAANAVLTTQADKSSFEDKMMLFQLFDRFEREPSPSAGYPEVYTDSGLTG